jgi:signal transduction histidine kinase
VTETDEPQWQPLSQLPFIASVIDGQLSDVQEQWETLQEGRSRPYVFDDVLVDRIEQVYGEMLEDHWLWPEQLRRWSLLRLTATQKAEIERLKGQADRLKATLEQILAFAKEVRPGTIDAVLRKSDLELGLEMLLRGGRP